MKNGLRNMDKDNSLIIFARWPEEGKVKSRLARAIGGGQAARFYEVMLIDLLQRLAVCHEISRFILYVTPDDKLVEFKSYLNKLSLAVTFKIIPQPIGTLAQKMNHINKLGFVKHRAQKLIFIGSDCPAVTPELIHRAFTILDEHDSVIGRARDGGYYLLGLNCFVDNFFDEINYSTESTAEETISKLKSLGLSVDDSLPLLTDIDTFDDVKEQPEWVIQNLLNLSETKKYTFPFLPNE